MTMQRDGSNVVQWSPSLFRSSVMNAGLSIGVPTPLGRLIPAPFTQRLQPSAFVQRGPLDPHTSAGNRADVWGSRGPHWTNADGWSLRVNGAGMSLPNGIGTPIESPAFITLDRISDGHHRTTFDPSRCIVTVAAADKTGVRGTATCRGVEWYDALDGVSIEQPKPADQPEFDAEITFEATP